MTNYTGLKSPTPPSLSPNVLKVWVAALATLVLVTGGWWYWNSRPAQVQAAIADVRNSAGRSDVMTVEAIAEGGRSLVGRHVSVVNAPISRVTGERTFWLASSDGDSLLVVTARSSDATVSGASLKLTVGARVTVDGVLRADLTREPLGAEDTIEVKKTDVHLFASEIRQLGSPEQR
jgi:hypothetical protein